MYSPDENCAVENEIRAELAKANAAGQWREVGAVITRMNEHHRRCPYCQGKAAEALFGKPVHVLTPQELVRVIKEAE